MGIISTLLRKGSNVTNQIEIKPTFTKATSVITKSEDISENPL